MKLIKDLGVVNGRKKGIYECSQCEELGINPKFIQSRIREQGMSFDEAIKTPENFRIYRISYKDKEWNLKDLCEELKLNYSTVHKRIKKYGWTLQKALDCKACEWILENGGD